MLRMEARNKLKSQKKDRKSAAAQNRMKTIANLAAEDKVVPNKKRKKGDGELPVSCAWAFSLILCR
jgi:actin-related protein 5